MRNMWAFCALEGTLWYLRRICYVFVCWFELWITSSRGRDEYVAHSLLRLLHPVYTACPALRHVLLLRLSCLLSFLSRDDGVLSIWQALRALRRLLKLLLLQFLSEHLVLRRCNAEDGKPVVLGLLQNGWYRSSHLPSVVSGQLRFELRNAFLCLGRLLLQSRLLLDDPVGLARAKDAAFLCFLPRPLCSRGSCAAEGSLVRIKRN